MRLTWHNWRRCTWGLEPKQSYLALRTLATQLDGLRCAKAAVAHNGTAAEFVLAFNPVPPGLGGRGAFVGWSRQNSSQVSVSVSAAHSCWRQVGMLGEPLGQVCADAAGEDVLSLSQSPVYLT